MIRKDILICGVGGQGTVLASKIIAAAAMAEGNTVHSAETIGMAQRGGPVTSHVRIGQEVFSPLIPRGSAELMLAFEPAEAVRNLRYLRKDGLVILHGGGPASHGKSAAQRVFGAGHDGLSARKMRVPAGGSGGAFRAAGIRPVP